MIRNLLERHEVWLMFSWTFSYSGYIVIPSYLDQDQELGAYLKVGTVFVPSFRYHHARASRVCVSHDPG